MSVGLRRCALLVFALLLVGSPPALADAPNLVSGNGITVSATRWITSRTLEADISTAKVAASAINGPHRVRITFPGDYFQRPTTRFPVLYLEHGGAGGNSAQWTTGGGDEEHITANAELITVMPDGGKVGWFTNWVDQSQGVGVALYVGSGINDGDAIERTMANSAARMDQALTAAGAPPFSWNCGPPGPSAPSGCDGGHNFGCWNFPFNNALPRIVAALQAP